MRKFFDSRRELVSSGPGSGGGGGSSSGSSHAGANFVGRGFTVGRHQVTVEEIIAEGEQGLQRPDEAFPLAPRMLCTPYIRDASCTPWKSVEITLGLKKKKREGWSFVPLYGANCSASSFSALHFKSYIVDA